METIKQVLIRRDSMNSEDADTLIEEAKEELNTVFENGGSICELEEIVMDYFGLEPDYLMELVDFL